MKQVLLAAALAAGLAFAAQADVATGGMIAEYRYPA